MSLSDNKELVRRYYEDVVSSGAIDRVPEFIGTDYTELYEGACHEVGIDGAKDHILGVRRTYPDLTLEVTRQIAEDDLVASEVTMRGTHLGKWLDITPTGRKICVTAVNVDRVRNGRIVEHGGAANLMEAFLRTGSIRLL